MGPLRQLILKDRGLSSGAYPIANPVACGYPLCFLMDRPMGLARACFVNRIQSGCAQRSDSRVLACIRDVFLRAGSALSAAARLVAGEPAVVERSN